MKLTPVRAEIVERLRKAIDEVEKELGVGQGTPEKRYSDGHREPCYYCKELCDNLAGSPFKWAVGLPHKEEPGVVKWHHKGCVMERLNRLERSDRTKENSFPAYKARLITLLQQISLKKAPRGQPFVLASGKTSDYYLDVRKTVLSPEGQHVIGTFFCEVIRRRATLPSAVVGVPIGGYPLADAVAHESWFYHCRYEALYLRKDVKAHGIKNLIEGNFTPGMKVVVLEDVTTSGASSLKAVEQLREAGADVLEVITVVDRLEGAKETFEKAGVPFNSLLTIDDIL